MASPDLLFWNRIEPHPRSDNIEDALKAEIRDPLWMLSRQWQLGEFQGEDAGNAATIKLSYQKYLPQSVNGRNGVQTYFNGKDQPLEAVVEKMNYDPDLFTRLEIGRQWFRMLEKQLSEKQKEKIIPAFEESDFLLFKLPEQFNKYQRYEQADILSNAPYINLLEQLVKEQKLDGGILLNIISNKNYILSEYILGEENLQVDFIGTQLLDWAQRVYNVNIGTNPHWSNQNLEYQFGLELEGHSSHPHQFRGEEYFGSELDWYQFDKTDNQNEANGENTIPPSSDEYRENITKYFQYPSGVKYKGMPNARWWELEDSAVNFGNIKTDSTGAGSLIFAQFNLLYSNDWLTVPLEMERGTLNEITEMVVTDNFGIRTLVRHLHEKYPDEKWGLFQMHDRNFGMGKQNDTCLFVPHVIDGLQKSKPIEEINFLRDEMANMVWAVEKRIPDQLGNGKPADEVAEAVKQFLSEIAAPNNREELPNNAKVKYQIATEISDNQIPFIAVKKQNLVSRQIQLQRASIPRVVNGYKPSRVRPKSSLLSQGLKTGKRRPFYIYEEEIPRSGSIIKGQWKRTRWLNGQTIIWYGYEKTNGRGEGNSGLKFDQILNKKE